MPDTMIPGITVADRIVRMGDTELTHVQSVVFGELVKLAMPVLRAYHSDLFHDAAWVREHITGHQPITFIYSFDESGTDAALPDGVTTHARRAHAYLVHIETEETAKRIRLRITTA